MNQSSETIGTVRQALLAVNTALNNAGFRQDAEVEGPEGAGTRYRLRVAEMYPHETMAADWAIKLHVFLTVPLLPGMEVETSISAPEQTEKLAGVVAALNGTNGIGVKYEGSQLGRSGVDYASESVFTLAYQYQAI